MSEYTTPRYPQLIIRVSHYEFTRFKKLKEDGLSVRDIIEHLCEKCTADFIVPNKDGKNITIPKDLLKKKY